MDAVNYKKRFQRISEIITFSFSILCVICVILDMLLVRFFGSIRDHITVDFDILNIISYVILLLQVMAIILSHKKITIILYMISFVCFMLEWGHYHLAIVAILILLIIKQKSSSKSIIRNTAIVCIALWIMHAYIYFALTGYYITKTERHLYESPYDNGYLEVMEDYQFGEKVLTYVHYGNAPKRQFWIYTYVSATERIDKIYNKIDDVDTLEIEWIDENTVLINGKARHILSK